MSAQFPEFHFRVKENGAAVFRVGAENRQGRIEMSQIAVVNVRNGEIKPQGDHQLTSGERAEIETWLIRRREVLAARDLDDILRANDHLNLVAQWAQSRATDAQLDAVTDTLLLTMHDLRSVLMRKQAERFVEKGG